MLLGVDVGGTFTDAVLYDGRALHSAKAPTTPDDQSVGVLAATAAALERAGLRGEHGEQLRARDDRRHQRAADRRRRPHGIDRHPGIHRPARRRAPEPASPLPSLRSQGRPAGRRGAAVRRCRTGRPAGSGRAARRVRAEPAGGGAARLGCRGGGDLPAVLLSATPPTSRRSPSACAPSCPGSTSPRRTRCWPSSASTSAARRPSSTRTSRRCWAAISAGSARLRTSAGCRSRR